ncbi:GNAT family N-acetyltransferase [Lecanosticta acicola]|uniref:GNAT family N-acetyltransferase n=1 Tax=Lecanosticta acicola TaxID=111012 RepID=A0AAI8YX61_9PEZI|nr:GNAT family N-acetyltransferase [Lecanosticta acicola]
MTTYSKTIQTERLTLRLADPSSDEDCLQIIEIYNDPAASMGGNARVGINTIQEVHAKHAAHGPRPHLCTKVTPNGLFHLIYLKSSPETCIGFIGLSFRREMPYPDLGYALFQDYWGSGYAAEAGREATRFWKEEIGVGEMFIGTLPHNGRSQRTAERIGFVRGGGFGICFGDETTGAVERVDGVAYVLPGMEWEEWDAETGERREIRPTVGTETEEQRKNGLRVG